MEGPVAVLKALADTNRLRIVGLLKATSELCVCDLGHLLQLPQYAVSRHLSTLKRAGLVSQRREGQWVYYRLNPHLSDHVRKLVEAVGNMHFAPDLGRLKERLRQLRARRGLGRCEADPG